MKNNPDCIHRIELDTEQAIRRICREYGIPATRYFELSNLNSPHHPRAMSYSRFAQAMAGLPVAEEHIDMLDASTRVVRDALHRSKTPKLAAQLVDQLRTLLRAYDKDPDVFSKQELSALRRILRRATVRQAG